MTQNEETIVHESIKPMIRQVANIDDPVVRRAVCESLLEMCDELIKRGKSEVQK